MVVLPSHCGFMKISKQQELDILAHVCALTAPGLTSAMRMIKFFGEKLA